MYIKGLVSVIVPTYNQVNYIKKTIDSILSQSYGNLEVIICDDFSTDGTTDIILEMSKLDKRIILALSNINLGFSNNVNKGYNLAKGEYVALIGGDDIMCPEKVRMQVDFLENNPDYDVTIHHVEVFDSDSGTILYNMDTNLLTGPTDWFFLKSKFWVTWQRRNSTFPPTAFLARSSYALHGRYDERLKFKNEVLYALDNYMNKPQAKWYCIPEILGKYRIHNNNMHKSQEMKNALLEETYLVYAIAAARYPQISRQVKNVLLGFLYRDLIFSLNKVDDRNKTFDFKRHRLKTESSWIDYWISIFLLQLRSLKLHLNVWYK